MDSVEITITNWDKYNPKRDQKSYSWFRLNNNWYLDPKIITLTASEKFLFLALLCHASGSNRATVVITLAWVGHVVGSRRARVVTMLAHLRQSGLIQISENTDDLSRHVVVGTTPTNVRTNDTNERTEGVVGKLESRVDAEASHPVNTGPNPKALFDLWNELKGPLPEAREFNEKRRVNAKVRLSERPLEEWAEIIQRLTQSDFATGTNNRGWVADFDFILQKGVATKILEGKYDNREIKGKDRFYGDSFRKF